MDIETGIDILLRDPAMRRRLAGKRVALLAHPASMTGEFEHSLDALAGAGVKPDAAFGPQHGMRGDKQDNMVESTDETDTTHGIPVFSLYGKVRRVTPAMLDTFDIMLVDIQDIGCRIYTFLTTLCYLLEDCAETGKELWVLDRPNPAGRPVEGATLQAGFESFVGIGPLPMRHGLTLGEAALWFTAQAHLDIQPAIVQMQNYDPIAAPGFGWPEGRRPWVNPSPNITTLNAARAYSGTVLLEGTTLSEGRGTTRPLELVGAPDLDMRAIFQAMERIAPDWMRGCLIRPCWFEPTFHKHQGKLCAGFQIHTDWPGYSAEQFKPYRLIVLLLKAIRTVYPDYPIWRDFPYEYTARERLPIDTIDGGEQLRTWVDDPDAEAGDLEAKLRQHEARWLDERTPYLIY